MNAFLIPPKHFFPISRLLLWFLIGNIGFREGYEDVSTWNTVKRKDNPVEGRHRWLTVSILCTEGLIAYKYRYGTGNLEFNPTPAYIWVPWTILGTTCFSFWLYLRFKPDRTRKFIEPGQAKEQTKKENDNQRAANKKKNK
jgi:phosphatidylserine synthase 2